MKVRCPNCHALSNIDSAKVPDAGAYANCPKCRERFFIQKPGTAPRSKPPRPSSLPPSQRPAAPEPEPSADQRRLPPDDDLIWEDQYAIGIIEDDFKAGWLIIIGLVVAGLGLLVLMSLHRPAVIQTAKQETPIEAPDSLEIYRAKLAQDLNHIRMKIQRRNFTEYVVEDEGPEFRFLSAMLEQCRQECWGLYYVRIMPLKDRMGFEADLRCYQPGEHFVKYMWVTDDLYVDNSHCPR